MRRIAIAVILFVLAVVPAAYSQPKGVAEGKLINKTDPSIIARGVEVEIIGLDVGMSIIRTGLTDSSGKFRIEGLPEDQTLMVRANYRNANYHAPLTFADGKAYAEIAIYEPAASMKDIEVKEAFIAFQLDGDQLKSLETVTFENKTNPPRTFAAPEGTFRVSKSPGLFEPPQIRVTAPGSSRPVVQPALESADGKSYYSLYPLRPGITTFEVQQLLPYADRKYRYSKTFYQDVGPINVGVIPMDLALSGEGLSKLQTDAQRNFAVFKTPSFKAGTEVVWEFSGGTPVAAASQQTESEIAPMPNAVGRQALLIGSLLLLGLVSVLWHAFNRTPRLDSHARSIKERREKLLDLLANLDHRHETRSIAPEEYRRQREESKRQLARVSLILKK